MRSVKLFLSWTNHSLRFYRPQQSWGKVIFSEACIKNSGPEAGTPHPPGADPSVQCMLGDAGNKRAVRILLECNLVFPITSVAFCMSNFFASVSY